MDHGRRRLWALHVAAGRPEPQPGSDLVQEAANSAVQQFWAVLLDFAQPRTRLPNTDWDGVGPAQPFLGVPIHNPDQLFEMQVTLPAALQQLNDYRF